MVFGGSSSAVAIAAGKVCEQKRVPFFGTLTYSTKNTEEEANRYVFRECYNSWMAANTLAGYLKKNYPAGNKRYFFITADYTWGHTTESSVREITGATDKQRHKGVLTPFPRTNDLDYINALTEVKKAKPDILVVVLFGDQMAEMLGRLQKAGIKEYAQIVVPNVTLGMAKEAGPYAMEGVIGTLPWTWSVPYKYHYQGGIDFVEAYAKRYDKLPSTAAASAYTILYEYKDAVERAGTFDSAGVIQALEGHVYKRLKDEQEWRAFDHQSIQTSYVVRGKKPADVNAGRFGEDFFEIMDSSPGTETARRKDEWDVIRQLAGKPLTLTPALSM